MTNATYLAESKALLAKLMAEEKITVIYENTQIPWFHLEKREVHLPIWKDLSDDLLTMLVWHEIGHALHTPPEGWHSAVLKCKDPLCNHKIIKNGRLTDNRKCYHGVFKDYMNVCEDARMERIQKRRFPGVKRVFAGAYRDLMARDYFGLKGRDVNKMSFIDRINVHTKMGSFIPVLFNTEEQALVDELLTKDDWKGMLEVCRKIYEYAKAHKDQEPEQPKTQMGRSRSENEGEEGEESTETQGAGDSSGDDEEDQDETTSSSSDESDKDGGDEEGDESEESGAGSEDDDADDGDDEGTDTSGEGDESDEDAGSESGDSDDDSDDSKDTGSESGDDDADKDDDKDVKPAKGKSDNKEGGKNQGDEEEDDAPESETDRAARKNDEKLLEDTKSQGTPNVVTLNLVMQDFDIRESHKFVKNDVIVQKFERAYKMCQDADYETGSKALFSSMIKRNKSQINQLLSEFNRRKNASQYLRQREARSGELDMRKLAHYKMRSDIFRTFTLTTKGKSHGLVMFLDMSSSMDGLLMYAAVEQILVLSVFCETLSIPFDVYGFSDAQDNGQTNKGRWEWEAKVSKNPRAFDIVDAALRRSGYENKNLWHILHLMTSAGSKDLLCRSRNMLAVFAESHTYNSRQYHTMTHFKNKEVNYFEKVHASPSWYQIERSSGLDTCGTPLVECLLSSRSLIEHFKNTTKVDIVNVIHLTDGMGNPRYIPELVDQEMNAAQTGEGRFKATRFDVSITDERTKLMEHIRGSSNYSFSCQECIVRLLKRTTGARHIGFYIGSLRTMDAYISLSTGHLSRNENNYEMKKEILQKLRDDGCVNIPGLTGFDSYYLIDLNPEEFAARLENSPVSPIDRNMDGKLNKRAMERIERVFREKQKRAAAQRFLTQQFANDLATQEGMEISANTAFQRA